MIERGFLCYEKLRIGPLQLHKLLNIANPHRKSFKNLLAPSHKI